MPHPVSASHSIVTSLQRKLAERADETYADWYRHNVKPTAPVRGVRMQDLRHLVMAWYQEWKQQYDQHSRLHGYGQQQFQHHRHEIRPEDLQWKQQHQPHFQEGKQETLPQSHIQLQPSAQAAQLHSTPPIYLQLEVTFLLFHSQFVDDRLAAMVFLDEVLIPNRIATPELLPRLATLFPPGLISDFKACDHFAAKVLQPLLIRYGSQVSEHLRNWFSSDSVWQARAALSALTPLASDAIYDELLFSGCAIVLSRSEEEAKSIVGSALRALGKVRPELVERFLSERSNLINTNAHCLNKATQVLDSHRQAYFREQRRLLLTWNAQLAAPSNINVMPSSGPTVSPPTQAQLPYAALPNIGLSQSRISQGDIQSQASAEPVLQHGRSKNIETRDQAASTRQMGTISTSDRTGTPDLRPTAMFTDVNSPYRTRNESVSTGLILPPLHTIEPPIFSGTGDDRNSFLTGVARGRITRAESGLRRRFRRSRSQSTSSTPSPGVPAIVSSEGTVTGPRGEPQNNQTELGSEDHKDNEI